MNETNFENNIETEITEPQPEETLSESITKDLESGLHSLLYKRINNLKITNDIRIRDAFSHFLKEVECGSSFSVAELICSAETIIKDGEPDENAGNLIYCFENVPALAKRTASKLLKNSVGGVYSLFALHNGIFLDLDKIGGSLESAETKRFLVMPEKKAQKLINSVGSVKPVQCGKMLSSNQIMLSRGTETAAVIDKSVIDNTSAPVSVVLGSDNFRQFLSGYLSVLSLSLCNCVSENNILRFGLGDDLAGCCARALGYFAAMMNTKIGPVRSVFTSDKTSSVAVSRPLISDGDSLYLLKLRNDPYGLPDRAHYAQLSYYLSEKKRTNVIKNVLPIKENIQRVINRLSGDGMEYVPLASVPADCFGIIVSVGNGETVNGIKLGYFRNI